MEKDIGGFVWVESLGSLVLSALEIMVVSPGINPSEIIALI